MASPRTSTVPVVSAHFRLQRLVESRRPQSSRTRRIQYDAAGAVDCAQLRVGLYVCRGRTSWQVLGRVDSVRATAVRPDRAGRRPLRAVDGRGVHAGQGSRVVRAQQRRHVAARRASGRQTVPRPRRPPPPETGGPRSTVRVSRRLGAARLVRGTRGPTRAHAELQTNQLVSPRPGIV